MSRDYQHFRYGNTAVTLVIVSRRRIVLPVSIVVHQVKKFIFYGTQRCYFLVRKERPLIPILSQLKLITRFFFKIYFNVIVPFP